MGGWTIEHRGIKETVRWVTFYILDHVNILPIQKLFKENNKFAKNQI